MLIKSSLPLSKHAIRAIELLEQLNELKSEVASLANDYLNADSGHRFPTDAEFLCSLIVTEVMDANKKKE